MLPVMTTPRLLSPGWIGKHAFALLIFATLVGLGFWQLARLGERRAVNAERLAILDQNPTTLTGQEASPAALAGRKVRLSGAYLNDESVVLRGQKSDSGVDGVHLVTPLRLAGGDTAVLVDRGWLPANQRDPAALAAYAVPREVTVEGIARAPQVRPASPLAPIDVPMPGASRIEAWVRVDVAAIQRQVSAPLLPLFVEALPAEGAPPLPRPADPRRLDEGPHLGYALQWFTFAAIIAVGYAALIRQELRGPR
ncbi:MAG: SURF1 family protein [Chloroflexales bacterium]|nr:SURF1 family protein [Chloroflexales bacterium]